MQALREAWPVDSRPITSEGSAPVVHLVAALDNASKVVGCP